MSVFLFRLYAGLFSVESGGRCAPIEICVGSLGRVSRNNGCTCTSPLRLCRFTIYTVWKISIMITLSHILALRSGSDANCQVVSGCMPGSHDWHTEHANSYFNLWVGVESLGGRGGFSSLSSFWFGYLTRHRIVHHVTGFIIICVWVCACFFLT